MMTYIVKTAASRAELDRAETFTLGNVYLSRGYNPVTTAKLVYVPGEGIYCRMECLEANPKAVVTEPDGPTYKDSCLEWFINCAPEKGDEYLNFEANSIGTLHCKYGKDRFFRSVLPPEVTRPKAAAEVKEDSWSVDYLLPDGTIKAVFGKDGLKSGDVLAANFYKCGDETEVPHFESWSRIILEKLDFHRPEFFGRLIME